jgi:ubiquinone/menaquinone biosynthesis C-methylase UbiE
LTSAQPARLAGRERTWEAAQMASFYERHILPHVISCACGVRPISRQREKVVPGAAGRVLELGIGGGLNLAFYDPGHVTSVTGVDPSEGLRAKALAAPRPDGLAVEILDGAAEQLPFDAASFDTIVCTYTLCSVASPASALAEARRVLKPGGRFLFSEHGLSPDADVQRWQRRLEPVWKRLAGGCHLTRPVGGAIRDAGFAIETLQTMYLPGAPRPMGWSEWGCALNPA